MSGLVAALLTLALVLGFLIGSRQGRLLSEQSEVSEHAAMHALITRKRIVQRECLLTPCRQPLNESVFCERRRGPVERGLRSGCTTYLGISQCTLSLHFVLSSKLMLQKRLRELTSQSLAVTADPCKPDLISYPLKPIGILESCFRQRNGTPRQPLLVPAAKARLRLRSAYKDSCVSLLLLPASNLSFASA